MNAKNILQKGTILIIIIIIVSINLIHTELSTAKATENIIYVDDDNRDGPWDGTIDHPYQYIKDGIDATDNGDTIYVFNGIYYENLLICKSVYLLGEHPDTTIIDGHGAKEVVIVDTNYVTIEKFTIRNSSHNLPYSHQRGIRVNANHTTISNNILINHLQTGIFLNHTSYTTISGNTISQSVHGIWVDESIHNTIKDNTIYHTTYGILLGCSLNNQLIANIIHHNYEDGMLLMHSSRNSVLENTIYSNENDSVGICLQSAFMNTIQANTIAFHRSIGISTFGAFFNVISDNTIQGNGVGLDVNEGYYNKITRNNFIENTLHAEFAINAPCCLSILLARNNWMYNYWDDHHSLLPMVISGILSYPPDPSIPWETVTLEWIAFDWHPAQAPFSHL